MYTKGKFQIGLSIRKIEKQMFWKILGAKSLISNERDKDLSLSGVKSGTMYGLAKVRKIVTAGLPCFGQFYFIARTSRNFKILIPNLLWPALKYSHFLAALICKEKSTSVLKFIQRLESFDNLLKDSFCELFTRMMSESLILFDEDFYKYYDGVPRNSLSGLTLANACSLLPWKNESLKLSFWVSVICRKHVHHKLFVFFSKRYMSTKNCQLRKIKFTFETNYENSILLLIIK